MSAGLARGAAGAARSGAEERCERDLDAHEGRREGGSVNGPGDDPPDRSERGQVCGATEAA